MVPDVLEQYVVEKKWPKTTRVNNQATGKRVKSRRLAGGGRGAVFGSLG